MEKAFRSNNNFESYHSLCYVIEFSTVSLKGDTLDLLNKGNEEK